LAAPDAGEGDDADVPAHVTMDEFTKRFNRQTARWRGEQRAREADRQQHQQEQAATRAQVELLTRMLQGAAPDLPAAPAPPAGPPQPETYASHDDYVRAAARYEAQQELASRDQQSVAQRQQEQARAMQQQLLEREAAFKQAHPDFDDVVRLGLAGKVAPHVQQALMLLPEGPALAYTLAQQPDLVQRLNTLPPPLVFAELGRLMPGTLVPGATGGAPETTPPASGSPPATTTGRTPVGPPPAPLPEPMRPVGGAGSPAPPAYHDGMSQEEYRAWRARTSTLPQWKQRTG
jgi:hypothetical protein